MSYIGTLNVASASGSSCASLSGIQSSLTSLAAGSIYTGSSLEGACQAAVCAMANRSTNGCTNNLNQVFSTACQNPYTTVYTITIAGGTCANGNIPQYTVALRLDLSSALGYNVTIIGTPFCGSITATFSVPVSTNAPGLQTAVQAAASNPAFLTNLAAAFGTPVTTFSITNFAQVSTAVPGSPSSPNSGFSFSATSRASWTVLSVVAAAIALAF